MTYATQQDLTDRYGEDEIIQLTDRAGVGTVDSAVVAKALADADAEINGYLAGRYALPLASVPPILAKVAADLARYQLFGDSAPDQVQKRYDDAVKFLRLVGEGKVTLGLNAAGTAPEEPPAGVRVTAPDRVFGSDTMDQY